VSATPQATSTAPPRPMGRPAIVDTRSFVFWLLVVVIGYSAIHVFDAKKKDLLDRL